jgi:hypothetical protein
LMTSRFFGSGSHLMGGFQGGEPRPHFYVDSVNGNDANDGLSAATAKQTIAGLSALTIPAGKRVGMARGSYWREEYYPTTAVDVIDYGTGALPILDGANVIDPGAFSASLHADAGGVVYETTLTRDPAAYYVNSDTYMIWEDGEWLVRKTSVAAVAATPGTFYLPNPDAQTGASALAYVHPFGSTNPTSDGKVYEATIRPVGLEMGAIDGSLVRGVECRRGMGGYGTLPMRADADMRQALLSKGGKHNTVVKSGVLTDIVAYDCEIARNVLADGGFVPFTFFPGDVGLSWRLTRGMVIMPTGREMSNSSVYSHGLTGAKYYDSGNIEGYLSKGTGPISAGYVRSLTITGFACMEAQAPPIYIDARITTYSVKYGQMHVTRAGGFGGTISYGGTPSGTTTGEIAHNGLVVDAAATNAFNQGFAIEAATVVNIHHNTIYVASNLIRAADLTSASAGSQFKYNIIVVPSGAREFIRVPNGLSVDYNVYVDLGTQGFWRGTVTGSAGTMAEWRSESGYDTNSVLVNAAGAETLFLNGVAGLLTGDFRLNPAYTGTFVDGTPIVGNAGIQTYYNYNQRALVAGQPALWPTPPVTEAECRTYVANPKAWNFGQ